MSSSSAPPSAQKFNLNAIYEIHRLPITDLIHETHRPPMADLYLGSPTPIDTGTPGIRIMSSSSAPPSAQKFNLNAIYEKHRLPITDLIHETHRPPMADLHPGSPTPIDTGTPGKPANRDAVFPVGEAKQGATRALSGANLAALYARQAAAREKWL